MSRSKVTPAQATQRLRPASPPEAPPADEAFFERLAAMAVASAPNPPRADATATSWKVAAIAVAVTVATGGVAVAAQQVAEQIQGPPHAPIAPAHPGTDRPSPAQGSTSIPSQDPSWSTGDDVGRTDAGTHDRRSDHSTGPRHATGPGAGESQGVSATTGTPPADPGQQADDHRRDTDHRKDAEHRQAGDDARRDGDKGQDDQDHASIDQSGADHAAVGTEVERGARQGKSQGSASPAEGDNGLSGDSQAA